MVISLKLFFVVIWDVYGFIRGFFLCISNVFFV